MSNHLTRWQAIVLGLLVLVAVGLGGLGLLAIGSKQGLWKDTFTVTVAFSEANDVAPGTPVRIRGMEAGQVIAVDYTSGEQPVIVQLRLDAKFRDKMFADAKAQAQPTGLLGAKVIAIHPGTEASGPMMQDVIKTVTTPDLASLAAEGEVTLKELRGLIGDARGAVKKVDGIVQNEAANVRGLVQDGRDAITSVKQNSDAVSRLPIVRNYVENAQTILVRPECRREVQTFDTRDLFEENSAILRNEGKTQLDTVVTWVKGLNSKAEIVVTAATDPNDANQTASNAELLTRKQAEVVLEYLRNAGSHKTGWWSRRKMTALGLAKGGSPADKAEPADVKSKRPASYLQVIAFTPQ